MIVVSQILIALAIADWIVTAVLILAARRLREPALSERAAASIVLTLVATLGALLGGHVLGFISIPPDLRAGLLVTGFLLVSVPQLVWFAGLLMGKFR